MRESSRSGTGSGASRVYLDVQVFDFFDRVRAGAVVATQAYVLGRLA